MIKYSEIVKPHHTPDKDQVINLAQLHYKWNFLRKASGLVMIVSDGFRTWDEHQDLYRRLNDRRRAIGQTLLKMPEKSLHLMGAAADIYDPKQELQKWILGHLDIVESLNMYFEHFDFTPDWVHGQIFPPESLKRFFYP